MIAPTFKNLALEKEINEKGFVVIPGFLEKLEVEALLSVYNEYHHERMQRCWNSHKDLSVEEGITVSEKIRSFVEPKLDGLFTSWVFPYAQFIVKNPGREHGCWIHRDDSIFDEEQVEYRQLWMPLVDLNNENGALYLVPKSHQLFNGIKPTMAKWPYEDLIPALEPYFEPVYARAGDLFVWIEKTLHGSYENVSAATRPAFQGGVIPKGVTPLFIRYSEALNEVEKYEVNAEFFYKKEYADEAFTRKYRLVSKEKYVVPALSKEEVKSFYAVHQRKGETPAIPQL